MPVVKSIEVDYTDPIFCVDCLIASLIAAHLAPRATLPTRNSYVVNYFSRVVKLKEVACVDPFLRRLRSWSFRFCVSIFLLAFLSLHCVSPHRRFHKPRRISTLKTKNIIFCVYLLDHNILSMDRQFKEDRLMVPWLKISSISPKEKYF
jgi:hypothetical protein